MILWSFCTQELPWFTFVFVRIFPMPSAELFDVFFQGTHAEAAELDLVKKNIGDLFSVKGKELDYLFEHPAGVLVVNGVTRQVAEKYCARLNKAGGISDCRPTSQAADLFALTYPACGYPPTPAVAEAAEPEVCPRCGKPYGAAAERHEGGVLTAFSARRRAVAREAMVREQEQALRRQIEREVLRQSGLPGWLSSRGRLIGYAVLLWGSGLVLGGIGLFIYQTLIQKQPAVCLVSESFFGSRAPYGNQFSARRAV